MSLSCCQSPGRSTDDVIATKDYIAGLHSRHYWARAQAARALGDRQRDARSVVPELINALSDNYWETRSNAALSLSYFGAAARPAYNALIDALDDNVWIVRQNAARALAQTRCSDPLLIAPLKKLLDPEFPDICVWAVKALGNCGPQAGDAVPLLLKALETNNVELQREIGIALKQIDDVSAKLIDCLSSAKNPQKRIGALIALQFQEQTEKVRKALIATLKQDRGEATLALEILTNSGERAVDPLLRALRASGADRREKLYIVRALGKIGKPAVKAIADLKKQPSSDREMGIAVAHALGEIGGREAIEGLYLLAENKDPHVRQVASGALLKTKSAGGLSDERLIELLQSADPEVRRLAVSEFPARNIDPSYLLNACRDSQCRIEVIEALGKMEKRAIPAIDMLIDSCKSGEETVCQAAVFVLGKIGEPAAKALPALQKLSANTSHETRLLIIMTMGELGPSALPFLEQFLNTQNRGVREAAVLAVAKISRENTRANRLLVKALSDRDTGIATIALTYLHDMQNLWPQAIPALGGLLCRKEDLTSHLAGNALLEIGEKAIPRLLEIAVKESGTNQARFFALFQKMGPDARYSLRRALQDIRFKSLRPQIEKALRHF